MTAFAWIAVIAGCVAALAAMGWLAAAALASLIDQDRA